MAFVHSIVGRGNLVWCLTPRTNTIEVDGALVVPFAADARLKRTGDLCADRSGFTLYGRPLPQVIRSPVVRAEYKGWLQERRGQSSSAAV